VCVGHNGDPCTGGGVCADVCQESSDSCFVGDGVACSDGDLCTGGDICDGSGQCVAGDPVDCSPIDGECMRGLCDPASGTCVMEPVTSVCDDGVACTVGDECTDGFCLGVDACDAGDDCNLLTGQCEVAGDDRDNDGLRSDLDPCPDDPRNLCYGKVATDRKRDVALRINANSSSADCAGERVDCSGDVWARDFGFSKRPGSGVCELHNSESGCELANVEDLFGCVDEATQDVFRCGHTDPFSGSDLGYTFDVEPGQYLVNMFFSATRIAEAFDGATVFDIHVGGEIAYGGFDPFSAAGDAAIVVVRSALVTVYNGSKLTIEFVPVAGLPAVKAIEILRP